MISKILKVVSITGLVLTLGAPVLYLFDVLELSLLHQLLTAGMVLWFAGALGLISRPSTE